MPYKIKKVSGGYKVCKKQGSKCFSKKPFPSKKAALKQMRAIIVNETFDDAVNKLLKQYLFEGMEEIEDVYGTPVPPEDVETLNIVTDLQQQIENAKDLKQRNDVNGINSLLKNRPQKTIDEYINMLTAKLNSLAPTKTI